MPADVIAFANRLADFLLGELATALQPHWPPPQPRIYSVLLIAEEGDDMLRFKPIVPDPGAPDVVTRELTIDVEGSPSEELTFAFPGDVPTFVVADGANVTLTLRDTDDAGNESEPSPPLTFTATDSLAPAAPGALGVELVGEE
jgi:hypothetical protein